MRIHRIKMTGLMVPVGPSGFSNDVTSGRDGVSLELDGRGAVLVHKAVKDGDKVKVHTTGVPLGRLDFVVYAPEELPEGTPLEQAHSVAQAQRTEALLEGLRGEPAPIVYAPPKGGQHSPAPVGPGDVTPSGGDDVEGEVALAARERAMAEWKAQAEKYVEAHGGPPHCPACGACCFPPRELGASPGVWTCRNEDCRREYVSEVEAQYPPRGYVLPEGAPQWVLDAAARYHLARAHTEASVPRTPQAPAPEATDTPTPAKPARKRAAAKPSKE